MNINILHVSDLHRDPYSPISNITLLDSLKRDRDQYASQRQSVRRWLAILYVVPTVWRKFHLKRVGALCGTMAVGVGLGLFYVTGGTKNAGQNAKIGQ